jgi:FkbH-like protein
MTDTQTVSADAAKPYDIPFTPDILGGNRLSLQFLLMGTCQVEHLIAPAKSCGHSVKHMLLESYQHSLIPKPDLTHIDAAVISLTLRHIFSDATEKALPQGDMTLARLGNSDDADELLARCAPLIEHKLSDICMPWSGLPVFVMSFLEPSFNYDGNLLNPYAPASPRRVIRDLNARLAESISRIPNCHLVDINDIINFVGRMHLHDDVLSGSLHASFIDEGLTALDRDRLVAPVSNKLTFDVERNIGLFSKVFWRLISDNIEILRQTSPIKLIVVDLDDTLWRGIAAEDNLEHWKRVEGWPIGFVESLLIYKKRGGLLALCSKNDREPTLKRLEEIWKAAIKEDDFASIRINWKSKAENIAEISEETNILPQNMMFIDDNPRELDEVRERFPEIRVMTGRHHDWRRIILRSPQTQVAVITADSSRRTQLIKARVAREATRPGLSRDAWLSSLDLQEMLSAVPNLESPEGTRAFELLNKTNQFNTTGRRWSAAEFQHFLRDGGVCLIAGLKDRSIDNGIVGVSLVKNGEIVQAVLSCRVFGLGAEIAMGSVATAVALSQADKATGRIVDTGKNFSCHGFFNDIGFHQKGGYFESTEICEVPKWIKLSVSFDVVAREQGAITRFDSDSPQEQPAPKPDQNPGAV